MILVGEGFDQRCNSMEYRRISNPLFLYLNIPKKEPTINYFRTRLKLKHELIMNFPLPKHSPVLQEPDVHYFINYCLMGGATVMPLDIDIHDPMWPGYCNPSIMWDEQDQDFKLIVRNVNYVLHGSKDPVKNHSSWGPILYSIPYEDGRNLKTRNFLGSSKDPINEPWQMKLIETRKYTPQWEFQGQEDARIVRWDGKLYTTGVRRDDNKDGHGRMELMRISEKGAIEVSRLKVKALDENAYCEKNWMPIKDMPFHYVQMANPTVVVKTDPKTGKTEEVVRKDFRKGFVDERFDLLRGSSQVVRWGDYWITIVHTCELWLTASDRKFARYHHVFMVWDQDWNIVKMSPLFNFANFGVEFTCGLEFHDGKFYIPFALEDNFVFLAIVEEEVIRKFIDNDETVRFADQKVPLCAGVQQLPIYLRIFEPINDGVVDQKFLFHIGMWYYERKFLAAAYNVFTRSIETYDYTYPERFMAARCIADLGHRDSHEIAMWMNCIMHDERRPEAYMAAAMYYKYRGGLVEALYYAQKSMECRGMNPNAPMIYYSDQTFEKLYMDCLYESPYYETAIDYYDNLGIEHDVDRRVL